MANYVFGIDFGTTHVSIACAKETATGLKRINLLTGAKAYPSYICPMTSDLSEPRVQRLLPHNKRCERYYTPGQENNFVDENGLDIPFRIGDAAYKTYEAYLTSSHSASRDNGKKFGVTNSEFKTVPASIKTILMAQLVPPTEEEREENRYAEFADEERATASEAKYTPTQSEFFATMFFKEIFMDEALVELLGTAQNVRFIIGTPPGCGSEYAEELKKCVKNGFYIAFCRRNKSDQRMLNALRITSRCIPEPLLAGYAWFSPDIEDSIDVGETAFVVDIGAGTVDWTFIERKNDKLLYARSKDDSPIPKFITSSGTEFGECAGNSYDTALARDLQELLTRHGIKNAIVHEQMARGIKELLFDPDTKRPDKHFVVAELKAEKPSKPITQLIGRSEEKIQSPRFHVYRRPVDLIYEEDEDGFETARPITFEEFKNLSDLVSSPETRNKYSVFLDENGALLPHCIYKPSPLSELDLFFDDIVDNPNSKLRAKFVSVAEQTCKYFTDFRFNTLPKLLFVGSSSHIEPLKELIVTHLQANNADDTFVRPSIKALSESIKSLLGVTTNFFNAIAVGACISVLGGREKREVTPPLRMYVLCKETDGELRRVHMHAFVNSFGTGQTLSPYSYDSEDLQRHVLKRGDNRMYFFFMEGGNLTFADSGEMVTDADIDQADREKFFMNTATGELFYDGRRVVDPGKRWPSFDPGLPFMKNCFSVSLRTSYSPEESSDVVIVASNHSDNTIIYVLQALGKPFDEDEDLCLPFDGKTLSVYNYQNKRFFDLDGNQYSKHFLRLMRGWERSGSYLYTFFKIGVRGKRKFDPFREITPDMRSSDEFQVYMPFNTDSQGNNK